MVIFFVTFFTVATNKTRVFIILISIFHTESTSLRYRYETRYRTATIMEEDALNQPTAAGTILAVYSLYLDVLPPNIYMLSLLLNPQICNIFLFLIYLEADLSLHTLSESPCGSLVVYIIPESSLLLPEVKTAFLVTFWSYLHMI